VCRCESQPGKALKCTSSRGRSATPANTSFVEPSQVKTPSGTSIGSSVFAGLTNVPNRQTGRQIDRQTDRQTDHATTVTTGRILCCAYTQGEVTSQNLRSLYGRHVVGITWQCVELKGEDLWSYSHKIESVSLQNVHTIISLPMKRILALLQ